MSDSDAQSSQASDDWKDEVKGQVKIDEDEEESDSDFGSDDENDEDGDAGAVDLLDGGENDQRITKHRFFLNASRIATATCLHQYAYKRILGAQDDSMPWPPIMKWIFKFICGPRKEYPKSALVTERNLAMLELMLDVPIWLCPDYNGERINFEDDGVLDYSGMAFHESLEILSDLLEAGRVREEDLRNGVMIHIEALRRSINQTR